MKIIKITIICSLMMLFISGCWDSKEAERMLYAHAIGVDFADNQYQVYLQIINLMSVAKTDTPISSEDPQMEVGYATGRTLEEAIDNLYKSIDQELFWGHLTFLVFSEEVLKEKRVNAIVESFIRYPDTRYQIWIYSTQGSLKDVLLTVPINNTPITIAKLDDPLNSYSQYSFIRPLNVREFIIGLDEPSHEVVIPLIMPIENWDNTHKKTSTSMVVGGSLLGSNSYKGSLINKEIEGLQWMNKNAKGGDVSFLIDENNPESLASMLVQDVDVTITPEFKENDVTFEVNLSVTVLANTVPPNVEIADLEKGVKKKLEQEIMKTYQKGVELDTDIYRLSEHVYRYHNKEWKKLQKNGKVDLDEDSISVNVTIKKLKTGRKSLTDS